MNRPVDLPDDLRRFNDDIHALREEIAKTGDAIAISRGAALLHLDCICRIQAYSNQLDEFIGYELADPELTLEENLPRLHTVLRMFRELDTMILEHLRGLFNCIGGSAAIGIQQLAEWAENHPVRQQLLKDYLATEKARLKRSRR